MAEEAKEPNAKLQDYLEAIAAYDREFKGWESRSDKILKRYRDEKRASGERDNTKFNCLWANIQTLVPACFSRLPQPDVSRRFRDNDPVGRVAALILERALEYEVQHYKDFRKAMKMAVRARFLGGRGIAWVRYEPHFTEGEDVEQITSDTDDPEVNEQLDYECAPTDYVNWKDFGHSVARTWEEVTLVWRKVYLSRAAVEKRFGEDIAKRIPYDSSPVDEKKMNQQQPKKQALIYELWDKDEGKAVWLSKSYTDFLDERDDPLKLQDFFPCPEPLYATLTEDTLIPVPDFTIYQDQANDLDVLADRIHGLCEMLKLVGVYDGSVPELARIFTEGQNGDLIAVKNWAAFAEKKGLLGSVDTMEVKSVAEALKIGIEAFAQKKAEMDELSGVIDVIRGDVDPQEKLGQTELKGQYASLRLRDKQQDVAEFATGLLQLKAQVICTKFNPQTIKAMAAVDQLSKEDQQFVEPAMVLLIGQNRMMDPSADAPNPMRSFRVGVVADTLVELDEQAEKRDRMELLTAFGGYLKNAAEVGAMAPQLIPLIVEVGKFGITSFKVGKAIEGSFDTALDQLKMQAQQMMNQPPPPDPKVEAEKVKAQVAKEKGEMDIKVAQTKAAIDMQKLQGQQQMQQSQMALDQQEHAQHVEMQQQDMALNQQAGQMKQEQMHAQHQQKMQQAMQPPARRQ